MAVAVAVTVVISIAYCGIIVGIITMGYQLKLFGTNLKLFLRKTPLVKGPSTQLTFAAPPHALLPVKLHLMLSLPQVAKPAFPWTRSFDVSRTLVLIM